MTVAIDCQAIQKSFLAILPLCPSYPRLTLPPSGAASQGAGGHRIRQPPAKALQLLIPNSEYSVSQAGPVPWEL